jgi:hypothetical protein
MCSGKEVLSEHTAFVRSLVVTKNIMKFSNL